MNVQLNDSGIPITKEKTLVQKIKGYILWAILIVLTIAAGLLVYLCFAGASEMAALTTFKRVSDHPYYTMSYDNFDYTAMVNAEPKDNNAVIKHFKKKFFKSLAGAVPGENKNEYTTRGSVAFYSRTFVYSYMKGRIYNSYDEPIMMVISKPQNGYKSWNIIDMADVGIQSGTNVDQWIGNAFQTVAANYCTSEGVNQEGLSVSLISCPVADCTDTAQINVTPFMAVRLMLDRATTVDSAVEVLSGYDVDFSSGAYHFFVSDNEGKSAVIEYISGQMAVKYMETGANYQVCSNRMESPKLAAATKDYNDAYDEIALYDYFDKALSEQLAGGAPGMSQDYAQSLLAGQSTDMAESDEEHYGTTLYGTQYTVFYDLQKMKMQIVVENDTRAQSYTYDLTK